MRGPVRGSPAQLDLQCSGLMRSIRLTDPLQRKQLVQRERLTATQLLYRAPDQHDSAVAKIESVSTLTYKIGGNSKWCQSISSDSKRFGLTRHWARPQARKIDPVMRNQIVLAVTISVL